MKRALIDGLRQEAVERGINRKERRKLESRLIRNGRLSKEAVSLLKRQDRKKLLTEISEQIPLSDRFYKEDLMLKYVAGELSSEDLGYEMSLLIRDVEKFIGWTFDTRDTEKKLVKWLRDLGGRNIEAIRKLRKLNNSINTNHHLSLDKKKLISQTLHESAHKVRKGEIQEIEKRLVSAKHQSIFQSEWTNLYESELGSIPSMDAFYLGLIEHFRRNISMNSKMKASDTGDIFHLSYLPYCDVFRADGDASQTAKPLAKLYGTDVVPKLHQIKESIDLALKARAPKLV